jgi:hypothetical protein
MSDEGRGNLDMSDGEFGVWIGEDHSCKEKATHEIMGEGVEEEVSVVEAAGHESSDGECVMDELFDGVRRHARDPTYDHVEDTVFETGYLDESEVAKHSFGVRGPQRVSVLFPHDCKKLLQVRRGVRDVRNVNALELAFMLDALRCEADFVHSDLFDALCVAFPDLQQLHR